MKKINLYLVRHGQTEYNLNEIMQGRCDSPLTEKGICDAKVAREKLKDVKFNRVYCSPLKRVTDTADIILEGRNEKKIIDDRLIEMSFGDLDGVPHKEIWDILQVLRQTADYTSVNGENSIQLKKRIRSFIDELISTSTNEENVLIVTHGVVSMFFMEEVIGLPFGEFKKMMQNQTKFTSPIPNGYAGHFFYENGKWEIVEFSNLDKEELKKLDESRIRK